MRSRLPISLLLLALVASAGLVSGPTVAGQSRDPRFFSDSLASTPGGAIDRRQDATTIRRRMARANLGQLTAADRLSGLPMRFAPSVDLNLFDDVQFVAQLERIDELGSGRFAWVGSLIGVPGGQAILAVSDGVLAGSVTTLTDAYEIRWQPDGEYEIAQVDRAGFRREAEPLHVDAADLEASRNDSPTAADDGSTFDLLVVYTAAARAAVGGVSAMNALIALGVTETNSAYATIGLGARMRLVDAAETTYVETGTSAVDLPNIRASSSVASRRTAVGADLVMLIVNRLSDGCGIGYLMQNVTTSFASSAYTVVDRTCISPNYTFAHELGHNMGSSHAPEDDPDAGAYPYSFGYKDVVGRFRTIMAYDCSPSCTRLLSFSTPSLFSGGRPLGTSLQDNARSLAGTRTTVANFRQAVGVSTPGAPTGLTASASGSTVFLAWSAPSTGTAPTAYIIEGGSSTGLANLANFSTGNTSTTYSSGGVGNGIYYLRVKATNSAGTSAASNEATLVVGGACSAAPGAPSGFAIGGNSGGTVSFTWAAASGSPTTYLIEAGSTPGSSNLANSDLGSSATFYTATGVGNGTYYVRLRARNACGTSGVSNEVVLVVGSTGGGSCASAPRSLTVVSQSAGSISLSWLPPTTGSPTSYVIEAGSQAGLSDLANLDTGSTGTTFSTSGVAGGSYYLRVRSRSSCGLSVPSNEALLFVVSFTGDVQVSVSWDTPSDVDLHVVDPSGEEVYWGHTVSASGGQLDVDSNSGCTIDGRQVENIRWGSLAPAGTYTVRVDYWSSCSVTATNYTVTVKNGSSTTTYGGQFTGGGDSGGRGSGRLITSFVHAASSSAADAPVTIRPPQIAVPSPAKTKGLTTGR